MYLSNSYWPLIIPIIILSVFISVASSAPSSQTARRLHDDLSLSAETNREKSRSTSSAISIVSWPDSHEPTERDDRRSRSLIPLPIRDVSLLGETWHVFWNAFVPFASPDKAIPVMIDVYSKLYEISLSNLTEVAKQSLTLAYGSLQMTIYCTGQAIPWDIIRDFADKMKTKAIAGIYLATIYIARGVLMFLLFTLSAAIDQLAREPIPSRIVRVLQNGLFTGMS